jgi:hypothetical protein
MAKKDPRFLIAIALVAVVTLVSSLVYLNYSGQELFYWSNSVPIDSESDPSKIASFDILHATVERHGDQIVFVQQVFGEAGSVTPEETGSLGGAGVYSYVWLTSLDSSAVGFESGQGILALAATSHPDFDDTPLYDENLDGNNGNDGAVWHSHWVVLVQDDSCGAGALKVRDIPAGAEPELPATWPDLPILIDSPEYVPAVGGNTISIPVPASAIGAPEEFSFDGVTAALRVNANIHDPLLCVVDVFDVASGDMSLSGKYAN